MFARAIAASVFGVEAFLVEVEVEVAWPVERSRA